MTSLSIVAALGLRPLRMHLWIWLAITSAVFSQDKLDPTMLEEVTRLVIYGGKLPDELLALQKNPDQAFVEREWQRLLPEHEKRIRHEIRTRSGMKPSLFYLLNETYRVRPSGAVKHVLEAIALRDDLTHEDVERVRADILESLGKPLDYLNPTSRDYLDAALPVLARDLTPANEDLLMRALAWPVDSSVNLSAAKVLASSGVTKALPAMQQTIGRLTAQHDPRTEFIKKEFSRLNSDKNGSR